MKNFKESSPYKFIKRHFDPETKRLFRNSSWVFISNAVKTLLVFVKSIIIARGLGTDLFGTFTIILAFVITIQEFFNLNLGTALVKFGAGYLKEDRTDKLTVFLKKSLLIITGTSVVSVLMIALIIYFFYDTFIELPGLQYYIILYACVSCLRFFDFLSIGLLMLYFKFRFNSILTIVMHVIEVVVIFIVLTLYPQNFTAFFIGIIFARLLNSAVCNGGALYEMRKQIFPYLKTKSSEIKNDMKEVWKFILGNSGARTLSTFMNYGDVLLLGAFSSASQVGLYSIAKKLAFSLLLFTDPLTNSIYPQLAKLTSEKRYGEIKKMLKKVSLVLLYPSVGFLIIIYYFNVEIITVLYGAEYVPAGKIFILLSLCTVFSSIVFWNFSLILSFGLLKFRFFSTLYSLIAGAIVATLLVGEYGGLGVASGLITAKLLIDFSSLFIIRKELNK